MLGFFTKKAEKKEVDQLKQAVQTGFNTVKQDVKNVGDWIKHLDSEKKVLKDSVLNLNDEISTLKEEVENLKNMLAIIGERPSFKQVFKQQQPVFNKQTAVGGVLNGVQTGVQTAFLDNLSTTERAIVFVLLNSDMKLSYEDLASMLGKRRATIRGQINTIRQKSEGLIEEIVGENNKKRVYIPEKVKEILLKNRKGRVRAKKEENKEEN